MSVINKMLRDLDRRNAMAGAEAQSGAQSVKAVEFGEKGGDRDWFWRVVAALLLVAVGWVGWVAYQLQPRPLVIESAIRAAAPKPPPAAPVAVSPVQAAPAAAAPEALQPPVEAPRPPVEAPTPPVEAPIATILIVSSAAIAFSACGKAAGAPGFPRSSPRVR